MCGPLGRLPSAGEASLRPYRIKCEWIKKEREREREREREKGKGEGRAFKERGREREHCCSRVAT